MCFIARLSVFLADTRIQRNGISNQTEIMYIVDALEMPVLILP